MKKIFTLLFCATTSSYAHSQVVISQIYGGGGNMGAPYQNDFVELFNQSSTVAADLTGYTIQYAATGVNSTFSVRATLSGTILPFRYYLVKIGPTSTTGSPLPTPDAVGSTTDFATSNGKVALVSNSTVLSACPTAPATSPTIDFVGYGNASCFFGNAAAPAGSNTNAVTRNSNGLMNTSNNNLDFSSNSPNPRNSAIILPLQLLSFSASPKENIVAFTWKTATERNTHHFEVEQSFDGNSFKSIAAITAAGNSTTEKSYTYTSNLNPTITYYRLRMEDADGKFITSSVVKVAPSKTGFSLGNVYPIPAKNNITIEWNSNRAGATTLILTDISGRTVRTLNLQSNQGFNQYQLDVNALTTGQYFLHLKNDVNQVQTVITKQ